MIMESLACSTPVVAFDIGGNGDLIEHKANGYLAKAYDVTDLARGINWICADEDRNEKLSLRARESVMTNFNATKVVQGHLNFYKQVIQNNDS
jgi:glycosyltransferase involved in cell wall biosynthesis